MNAIVLREEMEQEMEQEMEEEMAVMEVHD